MGLLSLNLDKFSSVLADKYIVNENDCQRVKLLKDFFVEWTSWIKCFVNQSIYITAFSLWANLTAALTDMYSPEPQN